jgi:spore germination protein GerM
MTSSGLLFLKQVITRRRRDADNMNDMAKKRSSIGCLFWIALILLVVVVFFFNRERIKNVLENTGFNSLLSRRTEKEETGPEVTREEDAGDENSGGEGTGSEETTVIVIEREGPADTESGLTEETEEDAGDTDEPVLTEGQEENKKLRNAKLYFIDVDDGGAIALRAVTRPIQFHDSPLTETLKALLKGLLPSELNMELLTLIPENSQLLSLRVNDGIAFADFNEAFRFNSLGFEGYNAQLKQIVYTATEFSTVESVQILIEGNRFDYLGPEGVFIGQPLTRNSFN